MINITGTATALTTATITNNSVSANLGTTSAGFFSALNASITVNSSTFTLNKANGTTATGGGGAFGVSTSTTLNITGSTFTDNTAVSGGAIRIASATAVVTVGTSVFNSNVGTISGGAIDATTAANLQISNSTFTANVGSATGTTGTGGALKLAGGTITINTSTFDQNRAIGASGGAIFNDGGGSVTITASTFSKNTSGSQGGAIMGNSSAAITIRGTTFSQNTTDTNGGAVAVQSGAYTIESTTFVNNYAGTSAGGFWWTTGSVTINNSTFSQNTAAGFSTVGGGAILGTFSTTLTINNSTIVNNVAPYGLGGGIRRGTTSVTTNIFTSTIIAGNSDSTGLNDINFNNATTIGGGANFVSVADVGNFTLDTGSGANVTGTFNSAKDPLLTPLGNYGGPTLTHKLIAGSQAINAGKLNGQATDQTGASRPGDPNVDIGAVEGFLVLPQAKATMPATVSVAGGASTFAITVVYFDEGSIDTTTLDSDDIQITGPGYSTFAKAIAKPTINDTNPASVTATYTFYAAEGNSTSTWDLSDDGTYTVTLMGSQVYDDDNPDNPVVTKSLGTFLIAIPQVLEVDEFGDADDGFYGDNQLTLREAIKLSNKSVGAYDTINFDSTKFNGTPIIIGSTLNITDSVIINGPANKSLVVLDGGGSKQIFNIGVPYSSSITMSGMTLTNGNAANGAAIEFTQQKVNLSNMDFMQNLATTGGAIALWGGTLTIANSRFANNSSTSTGAAIFQGSLTGTINVSGSEFSNNTAGSTGGAIYLEDGTVTVNTTLFKANRSTSGIINMTSGSTASLNTLNLTRVQFEANTTTTTGTNGLISFAASTVGNFKDTTFVGNTVAGNGVIWLSGTTATFNQVTFSQNTAVEAAIYMSATTANATLHNSTIVGNTATGTVTPGAGGIFVLNTGAVLSLSSTIVAGNTGVATDDIMTPGGFSISGNNNLIGLQHANWTATGSDNQIGIGTAKDSGVNAIGNNGGFTFLDGSTIQTMATKAGGNARRQGQ